MAAIGLPLIIIFIYSFSYVGAAMATAIIEAGVFTMTYFTVKKLTSNKDRLSPMNPCRPDEGIICARLKSPYRLF